MSTSTTTTVHVALNAENDLATIRITGRSNPITAPVLGCDRDNQGEIERVYLASRIHPRHKDKYEGWAMSGAISTILTRIHTVKEQA